MRVRIKPTWTEVGVALSAALFLFLYWMPIRAQVYKMGRKNTTCAQNLHSLWQAATIYKQDHEGSGDLLGYPTLWVAQNMQLDLGNHPCTENPWGSTTNVEAPYLYLIRPHISQYGKVLTKSFRETRGLVEGDNAIIWGDMNHNSREVPEMITTYPFHVLDITVGGKLQDRHKAGTWLDFNGDFWRNQ